MNRYQYRGRSVQGQAVSGLMDGDSPEAVATRLLEGGVTPISIAALPRAAESASADLGQIARRLGFGRPSTADLVLFTRQMYTVVKSGIPLLRGLRGLAATTHNLVLRGALEDVLHSLESGRSLADSFARHPRVFPELYRDIIGVGESTGTLEAAFLRLGDYLRQQQDIHDRVKGAVRYPLVVLAMISAAIGVVTTFVIPRFAPLFRALGNDIPLPTRIIMGASAIAQKDWYWVLGGLVLLVLAVRAYISTAGGRHRWHRWLLKIPVVGPLAHQAVLARLSRTLSISITAGMPMLQTLAGVARVCGNDYLGARMLEMRTRVERGEPLSRAAAEVGMFPPLVLQMIAVGEETGELPAMLDEVADFYEREVDFAVKTLSTAIEPVLIIFMGAMVLILALGVFLPMWNLIAKVGAGGQ